MVCDFQEEDIRVTMQREQGDPFEILWEFLYRMFYSSLSAKLHGCFALWAYSLNCMAPLITAMTSQYVTIISGECSGWHSPLFDRLCSTLSKNSKTKVQSRGQPFLGKSQGCCFSSCPFAGGSYLDLIFLSLMYRAVVYHDVFHTFVAWICNSLFCVSIAMMANGRRLESSGGSREVPDPGHYYSRKGFDPLNDQLVICDKTKRFYSKQLFFLDKSVLKQFLAVPIGRHAFHTSACLDTTRRATHFAFIFCIWLQLGVITTKLSHF